MTGLLKLGNRVITAEEFVPFLASMRNLWQPLSRDVMPQLKRLIAY
jgi:hypothetical protein